MGVTIAKKHCNVAKGLQCYGNIYLFDKIRIRDISGRGSVSTRKSIPSPAERFQMAQNDLLVVSRLQSKTI